MFVPRPDDIKIHNQSINKLFQSYKIRCIIAGRSGAGKTTFLLCRLLQRDGIDWTKVIICAPPATLEDHSYQAFKESIDKYQDSIRDQFETEDEDGNIIPMEPTVEDIPIDSKTVLIFDDFINVMDLKEISVCFILFNI